jgi:hypothetical protein
VTGLTATATEYGIELDWADNTEPDLARYAARRARTRSAPCRSGRGCPRPPRATRT